MCCFKCLICTYNLIFFTIGVAMLVEGVGSSLDDFTKARLKLFPVDIITCFIVLGCIMVITTTVGCGSSVSHVNCLLYIYEILLLILFAIELYYTITSYMDMNKMKNVEEALSQYHTNWDNIKTLKANDLIWFAADPEEAVLILVIVLLGFAICTFFIMITVLGLIVVRTRRLRRPRWRQEEDVQMATPD